MQTEIDRKRIMVLDTSAFISGFDPFTIQASQFSVSEVRHELTPNSLPWTRFNTAVENGRLEVKTPKAEYVNEVEERGKPAGHRFCILDNIWHTLPLPLDALLSGVPP
jgi:rRNA maturation endonuclease Nob1